MTFSSQFDISTDDVGGVDKDDPQPFPEGEHPLDNIPGVNSADLPEPDPLLSSTEGYPMDILGSYLIRCLHSKNWNLREAALAKICVMISNNEVPICEEQVRVCESAANTPTMTSDLRSVAASSFDTTNNS